MDIPRGVRRACPPPIRAGFARARSMEQLGRPVARTAARRPEVGVVGSGSNLLIADDGVRGLALNLDKELSANELDGTRIRCGGGARLRAVGAPSSRAGLTGVEFGAYTPGAAGSQ